MNARTVLVGTLLSSSALLLGSAPGWAAAPGLPVAPVAPAAPAHPAHALKLTGPTHLVANGEGYEYAVTERRSHEPAEGARITRIGGKGGLEVGPNGRMLIQFGGPGTYRMIAKRGHQRSNVLVVHVAKNRKGGACQGSAPLAASSAPAAC